MAERRFLGWDQPLLPAAAQLLLAEHIQDGVIDLREVVLVLPGSRAGRRLMELLVLGSEERRLPLLPPRRILTVGALPEELYRPPRPLATGALARRCWAEALEKADEKTRALVFGTAVSVEGGRGTLVQARILDGLNRRVGGGGVTFQDVAGECRRGFLFSDEERWEALARLQDRALALMRNAGRMDREEARRLALRDDVVRAEAPLVLIGVTEGPLIARRMVERVQDRVQVMIHAPQSQEEGFDELGFLRKSWWADWDVPLSEEALTSRDRPGDQASAVLDFLGDLGEDFASEDITVGVPDAGLVPYLAQRFEAHGQPARYAEGTPLSASPPYRLLKAVAQYLETRRFTHLAALLRHPNLPPSVRPDRAPSLADAYFQEHLPHRLDADAGLSLKSSAGSAIREALEALHGPELLGGVQGERTLSEWMPRLLGLLAGFYEGTSLDPSSAGDRIVVEAASRIRDAAEELTTLPEFLDRTCSASEALRILLGEVRDQAIPPAGVEEAVELVGWLELHLDDAPVLALTGVNDPFLPEAVNADPFLPNALCSRLGLQDNQGRYARDAYWLTAIVHSTRRLLVVAGRRSSSGDPLRPSRLLLSGAPEKAARRVLFLTQGEDGRAEAFVASLPGLHPAERGAFQLPPEPRLPFQGPPDPLPVTAFASIISDPYRWALESLLRLREAGDEAQELDPRGFGILAHTVLERFARTPEASSEDEEVVFGRLAEVLDELTRVQFGRAPLPTVPLQVNQLHHRLEDFARWQAAWVSQGWRIHAVEAVTPEGGIPFEVDGAPIHLSGRIDRIDRNEESGEWILIDYKTGDGGGDPRKARSSRGEWKDLQLPLYRHLVMGGLEIRGGVPLSPPEAGTPMALAYLALSKEEGPLEAAVAPWSKTELREADEKARDVVRWLREQEEIAFDPTRSRGWMEEGMAALLGTGILDDGGEQE